VQSFVHVHLIALRYFRETVQRGSMRQAAEALHVAPSAINRQILKLEDQLQCRLFERVNEGVRLTGAGEVLYRYVRELDAGLDRALAELDDLRGLRRGRVRIASEDGIARDLLPPVLASFHAASPRVTYSLEIASGPAVVDAVADLRCDLGLALHAPRHQDVIVLAEAAVAMGVIMRPDHPLAGRAELRLADLADLPLVVLKGGVGAHPDTYPALRRLAPRAEVAETNAPHAVTGLVRAGLGVALRSRIGIHADLAAGEIAFVPLRDPQVRPGRLSLLGRRERALPVASAVLAEKLMQRLGELDREA
jgi:DNA-binding transcriptional LysR family regulator